MMDAPLFGTTVSLGDCLFGGVVLGLENIVPGLLQDKLDKLDRER